MSNSNDTYASFVQRPAMRPVITTRFGPRLTYIDEVGRAVALQLNEVALAHLALSLAEAQAALAKRKLVCPGTEPRPADSDT